MKPGCARKNPLAAMTSDILLVSSFKLSGIFLKTKGEFDIKSEVKAESPLRGMELVFHFMRKGT